MQFPPLHHLGDQHAWHGPPHLPQFPLVVPGWHALLLMQPVQQLP